MTFCTKLTQLCLIFPKRLSQITSDPFHPAVCLLYGSRFQVSVHQTASYCSKDSYLSVRSKMTLHMHVCDLPPHDLGRYRKLNYLVKAKMVVGQDWWLGRCKNMQNQSKKTGAATFTQNCL